MPTLYGFRGDGNRIYAVVNTHLFKRGQGSGSGGAFLAEEQGRWGDSIIFIS